MSRNAKILIDLAVLAAVYGIWLLPKWRPLGRRTLTVYTLMYGCLAGIALFTLMPVLAVLPFCFDHPYVPMHMAPFEDVILRHGDYVRQIVLNIALFVPFGVLLPLCRSCRGRRCSFWRCLLLTLALSVGIEVVQPLLHAFRSSDITDVITNTTGGVLGYAQRLHGQGLHLVAAPGNDLVASTALALAGVQIVLFSTGRGTPFACPVPTMKLSSNSALAEKKGSWIDFDAGPVLEEESIEACAERLEEMVLRVASGERVKAEKAGLQDIAILKTGVTL